MQKIRGILLTSLMVTFIFLLIGCLFIYPKGKLDYFIDKAGAISNKQSEFVPSPRYLNKSTLYEVLPVKQGKIVFLGDSITDGNEWNELFDNPNIINRGVSGDSTEGILHRIDHICVLKPSKIFILIGTNDLGQGKTIPTIITNYEQIISKIKQNSPQTKIFVQSVFPVNENILQSKRKNKDIVSLNSGLKKVAIKYNVTFINVYSDLVSTNHQLNSNFSYDGLHLNGKGYLEWKKALEKYIK